MSTFIRSLVPASVPKGWRLCPVGGLLSKTEYGLSEPGDGAGNTPIVGMKNLVDGKILLGNLATINSDGADLSMMKLRQGDILLNRTNSPSLVGKVGIVREDSDAVFASYLVRLSPIPELVDAEYLNAWLNGDIAQRAIKRIATRAVSQSNINPSEFKKYCPALLPATNREQRRIAAILRTWDDALDTLNSLIAARSDKYAYYSRRFFAPCHPSFRGRGRQWDPFILGTLFKERTQSGLNSDVLLSITMADGVIGQDEVGRRDSSTEDKSKYKLIVPGDIGYNTMRMWQGVCGLSMRRGIVSPAYTVVTPIEGRINGRYAFHLFKSKRMIHDFERYSQGLTSDTWNLKFPTFSEIRVLLPDIRTQVAQANCLSAMQEEVDVLKRQTDALSRQKRGLMQKLLTGEWRVKA